MSLHRKRRSIHDIIQELPDLTTSFSPVGLTGNATTADMSLSPSGQQSFDDWINYLTTQETDSSAIENDNHQANSCLSSADPGDLFFTTMFLLLDTIAFQTLNPNSHPLLLLQHHLIIYLTPTLHPRAKVQVFHGLNSIAIINDIDMSSEPSPSVASHVPSVNPDSSTSPMSTSDRFDYWVDQVMGSSIPTKGKTPDDPALGSQHSKDHPMFAELMDSFASQTLQDVADDHPHGEPPIDIRVHVSNSKEGDTNGKILFPILTCHMFSLLKTDRSREPQKAQSQPAKQRQKCGSSMEVSPTPRRKRGRPPKKRKTGPTVATTATIKPITETVERGVSLHFLILTGVTMPHAVPGSKRPRGRPRKRVRTSRQKIQCTHDNEGEQPQGLKDHINPCRLK